METLILTCIGGDRGTLDNWQNFRKKKRSAAKFRKFREENQIELGLNLPIPIYCPGWREAP